MKKRQLRTLALSVALATGIGLTSCSTNVPSVIPSSSIEESTAISTPTTDNGTLEEPTTTSTPTTEDVIPTTSESTPTEVTPVEKKDRYNDIAKTLKLTKDYNDKTFDEDGIEEVTLNHATDGDTASFTTKYSKKSLTVRFYSIDTPESTGSVEKWGKNASKYTASILENAVGLLLESNVTKDKYQGIGDYSPEVDSYGSRYLCYVWYKETEDSDWVNLNLEIVENGYSENKCEVSSDYYSYFKAAYNFARSVPLHIHSNDDDPYYVATAKEVSVKELALNAADYYDSTESVGGKVHFSGYVESIDKSGTGTYMYHVSEYDLEDGKHYTFNVYAGYASTGIPDYMKIGGKFSLTGSLQLYSGKFQVSGLTYVPLATGTEYLTCIQEAYYLTFNSDISYSTLYYTTTLFRNPVVTSAKVSGNTLILEAEAINTYQIEKKKKTVKTTFTFKCTVDSSVNASSLVGKSFSVTGFQEIADSKIIMVKNYSDFIWK